MLKEELLANLFLYKTIFKFQMVYQSYNIAICMRQLKPSHNVRSFSYCYIANVLTSLFFLVFRCSLLCDLTFLIQIAYQNRLELSKYGTGSKKNISESTEK